MPSALPSLCPQYGSPRVRHHCDTTGPCDLITCDRCGGYGTPDARLWWPHAASP